MGKCYEWMRKRVVVMEIEKVCLSEQRKEREMYNFSL
jgi:hypothetical protein